MSSVSIQPDREAASDNKDNKETYLMRLLSQAHVGDVDSMRELGLYESLECEDEQLKLDGLEWLRLAAACYDKQAQSAVEVITQKKYNRSWERLGIHLEEVIRQLLIIGLILVLWKFEPSFIGASMILIALFYWLRIVFAHYYEYEDNVMRKKMNRRISVPKQKPTISSVIAYLTLATFLIGYTLVMLQYQQKCIFSLPIKVVVLLLCVYIEVNNFLIVLKSKRKIVEYDKLTTRLAKELGTSRLRMLLVQYILGRVASIIFIILMSIVI